MPAANSDAQNPLYQTVLILFLACGGQFLFRNKRQKFSPRHPFQPFTSLFLNGGNLPQRSAVRLPSPQGTGQPKGRTDAVPNGRPERETGTAPTMMWLRSEIFRNRVRRAHPKPFRLRRGIAARGLHGNTARRLRDGRRQPADNTLYRSSGRHGYGRAGRCVVRRHQGTVVGGLRNGISSHERNPCIAANRSCLRSVRHRNDRIGNIYGIHVARILVEEVHPVHCRRLSHCRGILPIISDDEVHRLPKGNTWSLRHVPKISRNSVLVISANTLFILPYPFRRFVVPVIERINRLYPVCGSPLRLLSSQNVLVALSTENPTQAKIFRLRPLPPIRRGLFHI